MELIETQIINANREKVWDALNNPEILKICIPGCSELEGGLVDGFTAKVTQKVGPVKATFTGKVTISDIKEYESYTITGEGKGGIAGFAKGSAKIFLKRIEKQTSLSYEINARVGGKLAQIGSRVIDGFAKNYARAFFEKFRTEIES